MTQRVHEVKAKDLSRPLAVETGMRHVIRILHPKLHVRLPVDPKKAESWDDRFILAIDFRGQRTEVVKTIKDDKVPGNDFLELVYPRMPAGARYTLIVDPGPEGRPYKLFENLRYEDLFHG